MNIRHINESFKRLYESDMNPVGSIEEFDLRTALTNAVDALQTKGDSNIKSYEDAFQRVIQDFYPDSSWWEVCDVDIFGHLFTERNPYATIDAIVASVTPEVTESLEESDNSYTYKGRTIVNDTKNGNWFIKDTTSKFATDKEAEEYIDNIEEALLEKLTKVLNRLNEAQMSDEDKRDSDLIRSMIAKMQKRSNASFTPEEQAVMNKYGIQRDNSWRELTVDGRTLNPKFDTDSQNSYCNKYSNGNPDKINYADRARKLGPRGENQIAGNGSHYFKQNRELNSHSKSWDTGLQDNEREVAAGKMSQPVRDMKQALWDRKYHQRELDNADAVYRNSLDKAEQEYAKAVSSAKKSREATKNFNSKGLNRSQDEINKLLRRDRKDILRQESLTEDTSTYFIVNYDSNGRNSCVLVKATSEKEAEAIYNEKKGNDYPIINDVRAVSDSYAASMQRRGMSCLN